MDENVVPSRKAQIAALQERMKDVWSTYADLNRQIAELLDEEDKAAEVNEGEADLLRRIEEARKHPERGKPRPKRGEKNE